jgi:hypothetical protein
VLEVIEQNLLAGRAPRVREDGELRGVVVVKLVIPQGDALCVEETHV